MCIRDSPEGEASTTPSDCSGKLRFVNWLSFVGSKSLYTICLLYTSDAADERSSVDLGGRRIIKKKKNVHVSCGPMLN